MQVVQKVKDPRKVLSFIRDEPSEEDKFGAHRCIAEAIMSSVERQSDIRLIGLLGRWGTGKSTIIAQLGKAIEASHKDKYVLFTYDAWAHQGDPSRRSILEELIYRLSALKLTSLRKWYKTLQEISGSTEKSATATKTKLSTWGKAVIGLLLLLPFFWTTIDGNTIRLVFADNPDGVSRTLLALFIGYLLLLVLVFVAAYFFTLNWRVLGDKEVGGWRRARLFLSSSEDILSMLLTRNFPAASSTTLRKSQPTAIEFRRYLKKIVQSQRPRRLIFVIDNLDRINPAEALDVWSIMVGMVADEAHRLDPQIEPIVILPFDPVALEKIVPDSKLEGHSASDLIEKSFDITFEVPPPVLSNWRSYFAEQYAQCGLFEWTSQSTFDLYWTARNFEAYLKSHRLTPRRINRFLNRVVSLAQQQAASFAPAILSYYLAHESEIQADCLSFLKANRPSFAETNAWQRQIAAIAFGTTENEAAQVLLGDELIDALNKRDADAFRGMEQVAGFDEVLTNFVESPPRGEDGAIDIESLTTLATFCGATVPSTRDPIFWSRLWAAWKATPALIADPLVASAIAAFFDTVPTEAKADAPLLAASVVAQIRATSDLDYLKALTKIGDRIADQSSKGFEVDLGTDAALLLRILRNAEQTSPFAASLRSQCSFEDVGKHVLSGLEGKNSVLAADDFRLVDQRVQDSQIGGEREIFFRLVGGGLKQILENVESADQTLVAATLVLANRHSNELRYLDVISELDDSGNIGASIARAIENGANVVASALIALRITASRMPAEDALEGLSAWLATDGNAARLLGSIRQQNDGSFLPILRKIELAGNDVDWVLRPTLVQALRKNDLGRLAHVDWLLNIFKKVAGWLTVDELHAFAKHVAGWTDFRSEVQKLTDSDFLLILSKLELRVARELLSKRIGKFDVIELSRLVVSGDEMWNAYMRLAPALSQDQSQKSELFKALQDVLSGSAITLGSRVANRALKLAPLLSTSGSKQLVRGSVSAVVASGRVETFLTLTTLEPFKQYISRPSIASMAIAGLLPSLSRTTEGRTFVERHVSAVGQAPLPDLQHVREVLIKKQKSKDRRVVDWANFVLDKSGINRR